MLRRYGTMSLVDPPPVTSPTPIFEVALKRLTIRGSIVATRLDLSRALSFAGDGMVDSRFCREKIDDINAVFDRMRAGAIEGRVAHDTR